MQNMQQCRTGTCSGATRSQEKFGPGILLTLLIVASTSFWLGSKSSFAAVHADGGESESAPVHLAQTGSGEENVPAGQYEKMRAQTLAKARMITGPKTRNPQFAILGIDSSVLAAMAEQRAYLQSHVAAQPSVSTNSPLLPNQNPTLLGTSRSNSGVHSQPSFSPKRAGIPARTVCSVPKIQSVNGKSSDAIFTPVEPDNYFRIEGCGFGSTPGSVRLQPDLRGLQIGASSRSLSMMLDSPAGWTDEELTVHIDPKLTGVSDFPVDLVVHLANGREVPFLGCMFVAARGEPQLLKTIPAAWVKLDATFASSRPIGQLEYVSPPVTNEEIPRDALGSSVFIVRSDREPFAAGRDLYDFSQLSPGWAVESLQLNQFVASCPGNRVPAESKGAWTITWNAHGFAVSWVRETCPSSASPEFNFTLNSSQYAAKVWVIGPVGTQPRRSGV